ncbi:uncharacterized protein misp3 [Osmerus eperlanus]|uniref:uncharacterized protein misp3 n=1 Tax=Osmerus eperlanus TaxID=29151 RepID=UPI002E16731C
MATEPVANRRSSADSLDEWANEVWTEGEMDVNVGNNPLLISKIAPKAEPEDIGLEAPDSEVTTHEINVDSVNKMAELVKMEMCQEVNQSPSESEEGEVENHPKVINESAHVAEEGTPSPSPCNALPPPAEGGAAPPPLSDSIRDVEVLSNPKEDDLSSDSQDSQEWQPTPYLSDHVTRVAVPPVEIEEDRVRNTETTGKLAEQVQKIPEGQHHRKPEEVSPEALEISTHTIHRRLSRNSSDDVFTIESPEGDRPCEAEDENRTVDCKPLDIPSARRQWVTLDSASIKTPQPRSSRSSSSSLMAEDMAQPAVPPESQQGEQQLPSSQSSQEHDNQEAAQQVFSQGSLPPATVATAPANQGEAGSQGCACVVMTERQKGEEESGEGAGGGQTGEEKGQKVSGVNECKAEEETEEQQKVSDTEQVEIEKQKADRPIPGLNSKDNTASGMDTDLYDDSQSDSGVSADFSPNTTMELNYVPGSSASETPIDREIRRAVQREQSLRRSRGLQHQTAPEYVDIPLRKSILTQPLPSKFENSQTKDRHFAGKKMQKEIRVETQREQVLVQLGKVPGFYDKGTVRQLKERKKLFEAFQEPKDDSSNLSLFSNAPSWVSASDLSTLELPGDDSSDGSTIGGSFVERRRSLDLLSRTQSPSPVAARDGGFTYIPHGGPGLTEGTKRQVIILDNPLELPVPTLHHAKLLRPSESSESLTEPTAQTVVDSAALCASSTDKEASWRRSDSQRNVEEDEEEEDVPRENPFFKLRSSVALDVVGQDIREARERDRELRRQRSRTYGGVAAGAGVGGGERAAPSPTPPPPVMNGLATPDPPVTPLRMSSGTPTVRQSLGKLGMWPPPQASEEEFNQLQVIQSPQTPRQKTPLLQRWESGLVNGHREGEED